MVPVDLNLLVGVSPNGKLERVSYEAYTDGPTITEQVVVDQNCPNCKHTFILNIFVHQYRDEIKVDKSAYIESETPVSPVFNVKQEVVDNESLEVKVEPDFASLNDECPSSDSDDKSEVSEREPVRKKKKKAPKVKIRGMTDFPCRNCGSFHKTKQSRWSHERNCMSEDIVCHQCEDKKRFTKRMAFYEHSEMMHNNQLLCHICEPPKFFDIRQRWGSHMHNHKIQAQQKGFTCDKCSKEFRLKSEYQRHIDDYFKGDVICKFCEDRPQFIYRSLFIEHLREMHQKTSYPCPYCERDFDREPRLNMHLCQVHWTEKRFSCGYCDERFANASDKQGHINKCPYRIPVDGSELQCEYCNKKFPHKRNLSYHVQKYHEDATPSYICHLCGKSFINVSHYRYHLDSHELSHSPYECYHCGKTFKGKKSMTHHILGYHTSKELWNAACDQCGERFATNILLRRHKGTHLEKSQCTCTICGKILAHRHALAAHIKRLHTQAALGKHFHCNQCNYSANKESYLKLHKISHLNDNEMPFQCKFCGKGFVSKNNQLRHEWAHTDTRPYTCDVCGKTFRHKGDLTAHSRLHTGEQPYQCEVCQKKFSDRGCFRSHLIKHEKELNIVLDKSVKPKPIIIGVDVKPGTSTAANSSEKQ